MSKTIKINSNQNLGRLLSEIEKAEETDIILEISTEDSDEELIANVKRFAAKHQKNITIKNTDNFEKVGFVTGSDIGKSELPIKKPEKIKFKKPKIKLDIFSKFGGVLKGSKASLIIFPAILLVLIGVFFYLLFYVFHTAEVNLTIEPKVFTASENISVSTSSSAEIKGVSVTKSSTDTIEGVPTGEKETGEKAKGTIKIFNKTTEDKDLKANAVVTIKSGNDSLTFTTNEKLTIPAKTTQDITDNGEVKKADVFGEKAVDITATTFGIKYNLSSKDVESSDIKISGLDEQDFSVELTSSTKGGTSKKVTAVLQKDIDQLVDDLKKRLTKKLTDDLKNESASTQELLEGAVNISFSAPTSNAKADDEIEKIKVTITGTADALSYDKQELKDKLLEKVSSTIPKEYESSKDNFDVYASVKDKNIDTKTNKVTAMVLTVKIQNKIVQKIDTEKIKSDLVGLSNTEAADYIGKIDNLKDFKIKQSPNLPALLKNMPKNRANIKVNVSVSE